MMLLLLIALLLAVATLSLGMETEQQRNLRVRDEKELESMSWGWAPPVVTPRVETIYTAPQVTVVARPTVVTNPPPINVVTQKINVVVPISATPVAVTNPPKVVVATKPPPTLVTGVTTTQQTTAVVTKPGNAVLNTCPSGFTRLDTFDTTVVEAAKWGITNVYGGVATKGSLTMGCVSTVNGVVVHNLQLNTVRPQGCFTEVIQVRGGTARQATAVQQVSRTCP